MEEKYLPIGTVCTIKNSNNKVMITGYLTLEYNGNFKMKDYKGVRYPEGTLLPNGSIAFNHDEIQTVDFIGYSTPEFTNFNQNLLAGLKHEVTEEKQTSNFRFDENGVVIFDGTPGVAELEKRKKQDPSFNPFKRQYDEPQLHVASTSVFDKIVFDEKGNVIAATEKKQKQNTPNYQFDENGTVIAEGNSKPEISNLKFDENGMVIQEGNHKYKPSAEVLSLEDE